MANHQAGRGGVSANTTLDGDDAELALRGTERGSVLFFPLLFLSGAIFPSSQFPHGLAIASKFLPLTYLVDGLSYLWIGRASGQQWTAPVAMVAMAVGALIIARRTFRWT